MEQRTLGGQGLVVSALGLGCMGMSQSYGPGDDQESLATIHQALDLGMTFLDTADVLRADRQRAAGRAGHRRAARRGGAATKFGNQRRADGNWVRVSNEPDYVRQAATRRCSSSRSTTSTCTLPAPGRPDGARSRRPGGSWPSWSRPGRSATWGSRRRRRRRCGRLMPSTRSAPASTSGRCSPATSRTSCWAPCASWGSARSPTARWGRGSCPGRITSPDDFGEDDFRRGRDFTGENFARNLELVEQVRQLAATKGYAQPAGDRLGAEPGRQRGAHPGTKRRSYLEENAGALEVELTADDLAAIEESPAGRWRRAPHPEHMANVDA